MDNEEKYSPARAQQIVLTPFEGFFWQGFLVP